MQNQPASSPHPASVSTPLSELRLVLLGRKGAGKSTAGNIILGAGFESRKPTEECVKRRADVAGRKVTVVDTPGWEWYYPLNSTPNCVRRETLRSMLLCPPGPHAVLLAVRSCASVDEDYVVEIEEHLKPLGTKVWDHTMMLFTRGDELGLVSMEQRIQTSGPGLKTLLKKCGNRYHVVENRTRVDGTQVKELMRKLEEMVERKEQRYKYLEMNNTLLMELEADGKRRARERRKKQRQMEAQAQRGTIKMALMSDSLQVPESDPHHSFSKTPRRLPEMRLVLLGERETGKSSAGDTILGESGLFESGTVTEECVRHRGAVAMRVVTVVDTPGWDGGVMGSTPERVKREIVSSVALCPPGPHALLLTLRVDTVARESHVREHLELLGEGVWRYTILLFTHGDQLREGVSIEEHIQKGGKDLQSLLEKCKGRYHMMSNFNGLNNTAQVPELLEKVEKMAATNRCEAFSRLVQEVKTLSRQRTEKHNQHFKELHDKMLRQEAELKNMRDREMKSLRWFFDWKKKVKSPGNVKKEEEEDVEKMNFNKKYDIEKLEERMRLLTEDKEREVQDLNVEHERIIAVLHQSRREADEAAINLELKERENEELIERIDEQQLKMLDLERIFVGHEQEKKHYKEAVKEWEKVVHKLQKNISLVARESAEWKERVEIAKAEMDEAAKRYKEELGRIMCEKNVEMNEMEVKMRKEIDTKLSEKDKELEKQRQINEQEKKRAKQNEQEMQKKMDEVTCRHEREIDKIKIKTRDEMEKKTNEIDQILEMMKIQHFEEVETILNQQQNEINEKLLEIEKLKEQSAKESKEFKEIKQSELEKLDQKYLEMVRGKVSEHEKEKEIMSAKHEQEMNEKDKEMDVLKEQHREEMARQKRKTEKAMSDEIVERLKEKEDELETLQGKHAAVIQAKMLEYEKEKEQYVLEKDKEIEDLKCNFMEEIKQILKEKEGENKKLKVMVDELKLKLQKQMDKLDCITDVNTKLEKKEKEIFELKECLKEVEERLEATEAKKEQERKQIEAKVLEKEHIIQQLSEKLDNIEQMLQQKEDEQGQILLSQKQEVELQLQIRDKEMDEKQQQLLNETERYAESVRVIEKQKNEMAEIQNNLASKEAEIEEGVKTQEMFVRETKELKECKKRYKEIEEDFRNKEAEMMEKLVEKDKDLDQMRLTIEQTKIELKELTHKMEKEMTSLIQEYERGIERKNEEIELVVEEKDAVIKRLEKEKQQKVMGVNENFEKSQKRMKELELKMEEEIKELEIKCEQLKEKCEERDKQLKVKELETENSRKNNEREVLELEQTNNRLVSEIERMKDEFEKQVSKISKEVTLRDNEIKRGLSERLKEIEIWEKEKHDFEQKVLTLERKQEELQQWEMALELKQAELGEKERLEQERLRDMEQKEKELEKLLKTLEAKQMELNLHGQDLQKKVRGLKDQEKELKDREFNLRNQEQGLINWTSELHAQNEHVSYTTQQLDEMGRPLGLLKEELRQKEKKLKMMFENLNKWEMSLQEQELSKRQQSEHLRKDIELMYQAIGVEKKTGKDKDKEEDQGVTMAEVSSVKSNNCQLETLQEIFGQKKGRTEGSEMQSSQDTESVKVIGGFAKSQRNYKILMLRESWSSRSPAGVSILGGEEGPELDASTFRPWRGQISGRHVTIVEPLGLKWRDGPSSNPSTQTKNILKAVSRCESEPDVVLLVTPVFLTCTERYRQAVEEHVELVGNDIWKQTMVVFTWGETLGANIEQHIERNSELMRLVKKCKGRYHVLMSKKNNLDIEGLFEKMDDIVALNKRDEFVGL